MKREFELIDIPSEKPIQRYMNLDDIKDFFRRKTLSNSKQEDVVTSDKNKMDVLETPRDPSL